MSLYQKYRPTSLNQIIGNQEVVNQLNGFLKREKYSFPNSILFYGESGCGKTTLARIIQKELSVTDSDFHEINSSEMRGIDTIREIIKNSYFLPLESNYRIFLCDEVHKLTNDAQNAFLKILEDTPKHVVFILCTTDAEKLIKAIRNRCKQFQVKPLDEDETRILLKKILIKENQQIDKEIYKHIFINSQGVPRQAVQLLEQILIEPDKHKQLQIAKQAFSKQSQAIELCRVLLKNSSWKQVNVILNELKDQEAETIRRVVLGYMQSVLLKTSNTKAGMIMEEFIEPFYHTGFPQLTLACYRIIEGNN